MKNILKSFVMSLTLIIPLFSQAPDTLWTKTFGEGFAIDEAFSVQQASDGGYIVCGYERSYGNADPDFYLIKTDADGNTEWTKSYGGALFDYGKSVRQTSDGGYIICGYRLGGNPYSVICLLKVNESGDSVWAKTFGGSDVDRGYSAQQTTDGGYIICGTMRPGPGQPAKFCLIKTDANGNEVWTKTNGPAWGVGYALQQTSDGGFVACGYGVDDIYLIKTTAAGDSVWAKTFGDFGYDAGYSVQQTVDGGYIICGEENVAGNTQVSLIKTNNSGAVIWTNNFGGNSGDIGYSVTQTTDEGYIISGTTSSYGTGTLDMYIIKTNSSGDSLWTKTMGTSSEDRGYSVRQTSDGGYIVAGTKNYDIWLIKLEGTRRFLSPAPFDKWIAGETDTVKWTATGWLSVNIKCITNFETPFESEIVLAQGLPVVDPEYAWEIPDTILSFRSKIIVENANNPSEKIESDIFRIKPYVLTRVESDSTYYAYKITKDRWGFGNYKDDVWPPDWYNQFNYQGIDPFTNNLQYSQSQGDSAFGKSKSPYHPDWVSWANTFGIDACYFSAFNGFYKPTALLKWWAKSNKWGGSCFGFAIANALAFEKKPEFLNKYSSFPNFLYPIEVGSNNNTIPVINELFSHQFGNPHFTYRQTIGLLKTPKETIADLREMLKEDNSQVRTISFLKNTPGGSGGHAILAYGLEKDEVDPDVLDILVYDNSYPNDLTAEIEVDTSLNAWAYSNWLDWGGQKWLYLRNPASNYLNNPTMAKSGNSQSPFIIDAEELQIFNKLVGSVIIQDPYGNVTGYFGGTLQINIPGSVPYIVENGSITPPYGYSLTTENYSVILNEFEEDTIETFFFTGNKSFSYERSGATQTQTDRLFFDGGVSVSNPDAQTKTIKLLNLINETTQEKLCVIRSLELAQNDSVKIENPDSNKVKLISYGSAKDYDIELNYATENGIGRFGDFNISLSANTSHTFVPDWENVAISDLLVLVDVGNDGTIDDTLALENQLSSSTNFQLSVAVNDGWNMVSTPGLHPLNQGVSTWWSQKDPSANVFKYSNGYQAISTTIPGEGYWMKHLGSNVYETGDEWPAGGIQTVSHDPISGASGWNLIGGYELSIPTANVTTNPPGLQNGPIYNYSGGYQIATTLDPGYGYWMKLADAGQIIIPETLAKGVKPTEWFSDDWGRIVLTDASGINYTLYAVKGAPDLSQYELPPAPPVGMFDVRFSSDRVAEEIMGSQKEISLSGITFPLIVRVEGMDISLMDETGNKIDVILKSGNSVTISDQTINNLIVLGNKVSMEYSLEQNYPNPFNPVTTIKYSLANKEMVVLKVYDVLGNEVSSLVNEEKQPGFYEVKFDASQLASGIYFYTLQAGSFIETKKMTLIK